MSDPFAILGVPPTFDIDAPAVEKTVRELGRALHPDQHASAPAAQRRAALGKAIEVNEAWRVLRDPVTRGEALLRRLGIDTGEATEPKADPMLLMEMMEKREALSATRKNRDADALEALTSEIAARRDGVLAELSGWFGRARDAHDAGRPIGDLGIELRKRIGTLRYYRRFLDEAGAIADDLD